MFATETAEKYSRNFHSLQNNHSSNLEEWMCLFRVNVVRYIEVVTIVLQLYNNTLEMIHRKEEDWQEFVLFFHIYGIKDV